MTPKQASTKAGRSEIAKARKALTPAQLFFYERGGYSYDPKTETTDEGRIRRAIELAQVEAYGHNLGYTFAWDDDWEVGNHFVFYGYSYRNGEPKTCEHCCCKDAEGNVVASVGCIDDATPQYRRVIEAELADEALSS
jgi:hypothetical protein